MEIETGTYDLKRESWRVQFYWPEIKVNSKFKGGEVFVGFDTCARVVWRPNYFGTGFKLLGFGIGFDTWSAART